MGRRVSNCECSRPLSNQTGKNLKVISNPHEAFAHVDYWRRGGKRVGLVPTMGALHAGHLSLVERSVIQCDATIATIFVNPTQFAPHEDLSRYPRTLESDLEGLRSAKCDMVFVPTTDALYPSGFSTYVQPPAIAEPLEGQHRPNHYRGVCTIVLKLFGIIPATVAFFGQKDYQQLKVIDRMVEDLNLPIRIERCQTMREPDGLAMSSRNRYLNTEQRAKALCLWKAMELANQRIASGQLEVMPIELEMRDFLLANGADSVDYARIVHRETLADLTHVDEPAIILIAVHIGPTRLIDNCFAM
jgi:pantoate--beta-alanine ligase